MQYVLRNIQVTYEHAQLKGGDKDPFRVGLKLRDGGWVYVQGLTHYEINNNNEFLIAGFNYEGQLPQSRLVKSHLQYRGGLFMKDERHVLMIFPHPDDETFSSPNDCSYIDNGIPVTYACLTLGQMGRNLGNPPFATRESLPDIRERELEKAMKIIGITDLRKMGLRDKTVEFEPHEQMDDMVKVD